MVDFGLLKCFAAGEESRALEKDAGSVNFGDEVRCGPGREVQALDGRDWL
jgi:hypothetical protein